MFEKNYLFYKNTQSGCNIGQKSLPDFWASYVTALQYVCTYTLQEYNYIVGEKIPKIDSDLFNGIDTVIQSMCINLVHVN